MLNFVTPEFDLITDNRIRDSDFGYGVNGTPQSNCSATCKWVSSCHTCHPSVCGNGILEAGESWYVSLSNPRDILCSPQLTPLSDYGSSNGASGSPCTSTCTWVQPKCGDGVTQHPEECDDGDLNGSSHSLCSVDCKRIKPCPNPYPPVCGNGIAEGPTEECDEGTKNGAADSNCTTDCKKRCKGSGCGGYTPACGNGILDAGEQCDEGAANGTPASKCGADCHWKSVPATCETCNPNPFFNKCTITTSCITTPSTQHYCACRAGYKADGLADSDPRQFRLAFAGQEYRVFVAPGIECNTLCNSPFPGPDSCKEIAVQSTC
jgi:cysteine-rich repeat protein